jgi:hypothetical protein
MGTETPCRRTKDKLPGRLQGHCAPTSRDAGPVNFIGSFGREAHAEPLCPRRDAKGNLNGAYGSEFIWA